MSIAFPGFACISLQHDESLPYAIKVLPSVHRTAYGVLHYTDYVVMCCTMNNSQLVTGLNRRTCMPSDFPEISSRRQKILSNTMLLARHVEAKMRFCEGSTVRLASQAPNAGLQQPSIMLFAICLAQGTKEKSRAGRESIRSSAGKTRLTWTEWSSLVVSR